jgi:hypothetical protein
MLTNNMNMSQTVLRVDIWRAVMVAMATMPLFPPTLLSRALPTVWPRAGVHLIAASV